jgi:hypothetical protein
MNLGNELSWGASIPMPKESAGPTKPGLASQEWQRHDPDGDSSKIVEPTPATSRKGWLVLRRP